MTRQKAAKIEKPNTHSLGVSVSIWVVLFVGAGLPTRTTG